MNPFPLPWTRLVSLLSFDGACRSDADGLIALYEKDRCWKKTLSELLGLSLESVALFYAHLEQSGSSGSLSRAAWPHSFSFMNVRALGREGEPGTFLDAAKVVPSLRTSCVHLGPFTAYEHRCIYAVASVRSISSRVTDLELERKGFTREWQLAALVAACRLLGKSAAYDIEPHVTQFAIPVLEHPEAFRWIRLDAGKKALSHPSSEILRDDVQACIVDEVRTTVVPMMRAAGETSLEYANEDERLRREPLHHAIIGGLIEQGLWTVPSQIWAGDGVPEFNYMHADGYPVFSCRDRKGKDRRDEALNVVTPFRFDREHSLFDDIFPYWRDRFGFRVVRFDSVDHIFDSCDGFDSPRSDRPAPSHLARCISHAASSARRTAEKLFSRLPSAWGGEYAEYSSCGFDAMLGGDMFGRIGKEFAEKTLALSARLEKFNARSSSPIGVCFAVDTHDTGDPNLLGAPLVQTLSSAELLQRHFLSRFASCGKGLRPKYEVVGCADRSFGLFRSNVSEENMTLRGDTEHLRRYHFLEDVYDDISGVMCAGTLIESKVTKDGARWTVSDGERTTHFAMAFPKGKGLKLKVKDGRFSALMYSCALADRAPSEIPPGECCVVSSHFFTDLTSADDPLTKAYSGGHMKSGFCSVIAAALFALFAGCGTDEAFVKGLPKISSFDAQKYMGTWYEVARFQHSFEKDVIRTTANYTLRADGTVDVVNAGVDVNDTSKKKEAHAVAHLVKGDVPGYLRVSFFRPFYGDYRIIALDEKNYQYALVTSSSRDYLWILSRTKSMDPALYASLVETARKSGLDVTRIYRVPQE